MVGRKATAGDGEQQSLGRLHSICNADSNTFGLTYYAEQLKGGGGGCEGSLATLGDHVYFSGPETELRGEITVKRSLMVCLGCLVVGWRKVEKQAATYTKMAAKCTRSMVRPFAYFAVGHHQAHDDYFS